MYFLWFYSFWVPIEFHHKLFLVCMNSIVLFVSLLEFLVLLKHDSFIDIVEVNQQARSNFHVGL